MFWCHGPPDIGQAATVQGHDPEVGAWAFRLTRTKELDNPTSQLLPISRNRSWSGTGREERERRCLKDCVWERLCVKDCVWQSCVKDCVWQSCVKDCVWQSCVCDKARRRRRRRRRTGYRTKNKNPKQWCGEKNIKQIDNSSYHCYQPPWKSEVLTVVPRCNSFLCTILRGLGNSIFNTHQYTNAHTFT